MSRQGMIIAGQYASELPAFANIKDAERVLYDLRDAGIRALQDNDNLAGTLDYSVESLKTLEQWFFENGNQRQQITAIPRLTRSAFILARYFAVTQSLSGPSMNLPVREDTMRSVSKGGRYRLC